MIKNYYYLLVGVLVIFSAVTHAWNGHLVTLPMLEVDVLDIHARTIFFYVWHIITAENLIFGVVFLLMAFYKDLSKVRFAAWMIGIIMIGRWIVIFGSTLYKNKTDLLEILIDSIAIIIVVVLIILGIRVKNNTRVKNKNPYNMNKKMLVIERTYEAPIEKVWEAITNKEQMKQWYFEISDFKAEVGFEFQFYGGSEKKRYLHRCTIVEVEPLRKIAYTWSYEGYSGQSLVTFELFSKDSNNTRLKLTHSDLTTFPTDNPDFSEKNFNEGWNSILGQSLRNFVEMDSFTRSIHISASRKDIWDIVLNPDNQWGVAFGGGAFAETDWKEGSAIIWRDTEKNIAANGIVEVHQPGEYLQLHYYDESEPKPATLLGDYYEKFTLVHDEDEYLLSIEIGKITKIDIPLFEEMWDKALHIIKKLAERKE